MNLIHSDFVEEWLTGPYLAQVTFKILSEADLVFKASRNVNYLMITALDVPLSGNCFTLDSEFSKCCTANSFP